MIDRVVVSSDSPSILRAGSEAGAEVLMRPARLARDGTAMADVVRHSLEELDRVGILVVLQPTSPLRTATDVGRVLSVLEEGALSATTVVHVEHPPSWHFELGQSGRLEPLAGWAAVPSRRQDAPPYVRLTGAVYAARADYLRGGGPLVGPETRGVLVPPERSIDIDSEFDLHLANFLATARS